MAFRKRREALRAILSGSSCIHPGSVYDATSIRIAEDLGFRGRHVRRLGGVAGGARRSRHHPDHADRTGRADAADVARGRTAGAGRCRPWLWQCAECPPHRAGTGSGRRGRPHHRGHLAAAGFWRGQDATDFAGGRRRQDEGRARRPRRSLAGDRGAHRGRSITSLDDAIKRAKAYEATGVDALFFTGIKTRAELEAIAAATRLPIVLGGAPEEMNALDYLAGQRVRIALQGHAPFAAATQAVYETLKALREGASPKSLKGLASIGIDRPRYARGRHEEAQRRISRAEEIDECDAIRSRDDPRQGAGRRLSRLGRARGEGAKPRGLGA